MTHRRPPQTDLFSNCTEEKEGQRNGNVNRDVKLFLRPLTIFGGRVRRSPIVQQDLARLRSVSVANCERISSSVGEQVDVCCRRCERKRIFLAECGLAGGYRAGTQVGLITFYFYPVATRFRRLSPRSMFVPSCAHVYSWTV